MSKLKNNYEVHYNMNFVNFLYIFLKIIYWDEIKGQHLIFFEKYEIFNLKIRHSIMSQQCHSQNTCINFFISHKLAMTT
jgi:hypothetical protein